MPELYVDLAIPVAVDSIFTYRVPDHLRHLAIRGVRALAPFGKRSAVGIVVGISETRPQRPGLTSAIRLRDISDILDLRPVLSEEMLRLTEWISRYYFAPWGEVVRSALIHGASLTTYRRIHASPGTDPPPDLARKLRSLHSFISDTKSTTLDSVRKKFGSTGLYAGLNELARLKLIELEEFRPAPKAGRKRESVIEISPGYESRWNDWIEANGSSARNRKQADALRSLMTLGSGTHPVAPFLASARHGLSTLKTLEKKGLITLSLRDAPLADSESAGWIDSKPITLNDHQRLAVEQIDKAITQNSFTAFLLHGVTGSGKTQVYVEVIRQALSLGKSAIVLVPEISLTPQTVGRFRLHFHDQVVALHSRLSEGERHDAWRRIREGKHPVVIGPRSTIFAPVERLGLVVVDEEQEASFKQFDQTPRYHARDVAIMRASYNQATVVLGSATPSLESYSNAKSGKYVLLELPERVDNASLPRVEIVDMAIGRKKKLEEHHELRKAEFKADYSKARANPTKLEMSSVSDELRDKITDRLSRKEGIILLQNRRGFAPFIECPSCGHVVTCENCSISLIYHLPQRHCRCHYCGFVAPAPDVCPSCGSAEIKLRGAGTQRVEEELHKLFPGTSILRMDLDTTTKKGSHSKILEQFAQGKADILLGTQMVAKGLDFSRVTLVGVISADTQMMLPDFRSSERTFQLLTQVAGRAGRSALAGEVMIQTLQPGHFALRHVVDHDFKSFYDEELAFREELEYPPFSRLILLEFRGTNEGQVSERATAMGSMIASSSGELKILGPAPAALAKIDKYYRWHLLLKDLKRLDPSGSRIHRRLRSALAAYDSKFGRKNEEVRLIIDVDPTGMM